jgi:hypothetical protein
MRDWRYRGVKLTQVTWLFSAVQEVWARLIQHPCSLAHSTLQHTRLSLKVRHPQVNRPWQPLQFLLQLSETGSDITIEATKRTDKIHQPTALDMRQWEEWSPRDEPYYCTASFPEILMLQATRQEGNTWDQPDGPSEWRKQSWGSGEISMNRHCKRENYRAPSSTEKESQRPTEGPPAPTKCLAQYASE